LKVTHKEDLGYFHAHQDFPDMKIGQITNWN
jgi:hypothetical protein